MNVYVKRVGNLREDLNALLDHVSWREVIGEGDTVVIKPNFCSFELGEGVTTNLELIKTLVSLLSDQAGRVIVGETSSNWNDLDQLIGKLDLGCEFVNLSRLESRVFESPFGPLSLPAILFESRLVNLPVLKTHVLTKLTLGVKNLFGLLQVKDKDRYHGVIHQFLPYLLGIVKPDLNILDATYSMLGRGGPTSGKVVKTNLLLASRDAVSLDMAACRFFGLEPNNVRHIKAAAERFGTKPVVMGDVDAWTNLTGQLSIKDRAAGYFKMG